MTRLLDICDAALGRLLDWTAGASWRAAAIIGLVALAMALPGQTTLPVTDRDEARFVQASKQMLETGDPIDIRFQDQPRWKKPVGIYWLQAAAAAALDGGVEADVWAYRAPSALAGVLVALLTVWAARPLVGARAAALAGIMMALSLLMAAEAHIAKTDAALTATAVAALGALARMLAGEGGRGTALIFWLSIAASILLKGPIVPAICGLALAWVWIVGRTRPPFARLEPLWGPGLAIALVAPWLIAIAIVSDGRFFVESLGHDMAAKIAAGQEKHWGPPGLYLAMVWGTLWPWAALVPIAAGWWWRERRAWWLMLLAGWVTPFWLVLEAVPTKLPHYVLPLYPALIIALAGWLGNAATVAPAAPRWTRFVSAALAAMPAVALALACLILPSALGEDPVWPGVALALLGAAAGLVAARAATAGRPLAQVAASAAAALALYPAVLHFVLPSLTLAFPSPRMAALIAQYEPCASGPPYSVGYHEPSLVFLTRTDIRMGDADRAARALADDPGALVLIEDRWRESLGERLAGAVVRADLEYFNYNRGKMATAQLLTRDDARWAACDAG